MERRFRLFRFIPPDLIPRIIACSDRFVKRSPIASNSFESGNRLWKSAFSQKHGGIQIWLWLEDFTDSSMSDKAGVEGAGRRAVIRIAGFGSIFKHKAIATLLEKYGDAVSHVLKEFPGLCHLSQTVVCPMCMMAQHEDEDCGEFQHFELQKQLETISLEDSHYLQSTVDSATLGKIRRFELCPLRQCNVPIEYLLDCSEVEDSSSIQEKGRLHDSQALVKQMDQSLNYLMSEIIRLSAVPSVKVEKSFASVAIAIVNSAEMKRFRDWVSSPDRSIVDPPNVQTRITNFASGSFCKIPSTFPKEEATVVLSCAHFCINTDNKEYPKRDSIPDFGQEIVYLVGGM